MANRITDTNKWTKPWFRSLSPKHKLLWVFMCDNCDCAGVYHVDVDLLNFIIGDIYSISEIESALGDKVILFDNNKLYIKGFVEYQYKCAIEELNPLNFAHRGVIRLIDKYKAKGLDSPCVHLPQGDRNRNRNRNRNSKDIPDDFIKFWDFYHSESGKPKTDQPPALKYWNALSVSEKSAAMENAKKYFATVSEKKYIKKARTYLKDKSFNDDFTIPPQERRWI